MVVQQMKCNKTYQVLRIVKAQAKYSVNVSYFFKLNLHLCYVESQEWFTNIFPRDFLNRGRGGSCWKLHRAVVQSLNLYYSFLIHHLFSC